MTLTSPLRNPRKFRTPFLSPLNPHKISDMPPDSQLARRTPAGIQIRPDPVRLKWELTDLTTSDGHLARATFTTAARVLPDATELRMLDEALLGSRTILTTID